MDDAILPGAFLLEPAGLLFFGRAFLVAGFAGVGLALVGLAAVFFVVFPALAVADLPVLALPAD